MYRSRGTLKLLPVVLTLVLVAAACGSDDDDAAPAATTAAPAATTAAPAATTAAPAATTAAPADESAAEEAAGVLAAVCPSPIIVQTDWHAQAEHGPTYELLGQDYVIDASNYSVTGTLVASGEVDTGVDIEIREGGPATGWQQTASVMYQDPDIFLGYTSTDGAVEASAEQPTVSVAVIMEKNPQIIMWNPEQFPGVERVEDLPDDTSVIVSWMATYLYWLVDQGIIDKSQIEESYEAGVSRFVAEDGAYGQQGYASAEPYIYEVETPEYGKAVQYELTHDMGYETYSQNYGVLPERIEEDRACLELLVPILQQGMVDYVTDGAEANAVIMDVNGAYEDGWVYEEGLAEFGHTELGRLGLIGNGPDGTIGKHDMDRVQRMIDSLVPVFGNPEVNIEILEGLTPGDIATNEFIDDSIGLATTLAATWEIIQDYVDENGLNGASFIVVDRDAGVLYEEHSGELGPGRIAMIGPLAEMISAGVVLKLHEDGLLDIDAPVADVVAWGSGNPEVTLAQLLSHSSGMVGGLPSQFYAPYTCSVMFMGSLQGCGETIFTTPDDDADLVPPDTVFGWPATGADYQVAGAVAEAASGKTWAELVDETYAPCGLEVLAYNNPWFQLPFDPATFAYPSAAFDGDPSTLAPTDNPSIEAGAYTTPEDYAALLLMHLRDGMCGDQRVLSTESLERMHEDRIARVYDGGNPFWDPETGDATGVVWGYGMGFMIDREVGGRLGMATPFGQQIWMDLDTGYAALLLLESSFPDALALYDLVPDALHEAILTARG